MYALFLRSAANVGVQSPALLTLPIFTPKSFPSGLSKINIVKMVRLFDFTFYFRQLYYDCNGKTNTGRRFGWEKTSEYLKSYFHTGFLHWNECQGSGFRILLWSRCLFEVCSEKYVLKLNLTFRWNSFQEIRRLQNLLSSYTTFMWQTHTKIVKKSFSNSYKLNYHIIKFGNYKVANGI